VTEERRKEWAEHILTVHAPDFLNALESFEREVAEHAKREERARSIGIVQRFQDSVGARNALPLNQVLRQIGASILEGA
jgi:acetoin utilization deacetylase AcuC-like enzyme